jgi:hypothetical protein
MVYQTARAILNGLRSIPGLILGILFVAAVGFGALPGVLALGLHSVGMVRKFFSESIEHVDVEPVEAVQAAGASAMQTLFHGILPGFRDTPPLGFWGIPKELLDWEMNKAEVAPTNFRNSLRFKDFSRNIKRLL